MYGHDPIICKEEQKNFKVPLYHKRTQLSIVYQQLNIFENEYELKD